MLNSVDTPVSDEGRNAVSTPLSIPERPARLNEIVVSSLIEAVVSGNLSVGSSLPPEQILCEDFKVSRSVIRESVKLLEEKGLVVARQGQGTTVQPVDHWSLLDPLVLDAYIRNDRSLSIFDDLMEVRAALESQIVSRAAVRLSADQLEEVHARLVGLESLLEDPDNYALADVAYHDLIARFSGHLLARSILRTVQPVALANAYYGRTHRSREDNLRSHDGHAKIYEALLKRDPIEAASAVEEHILGSWDTYKRSLHESTTSSSQDES
jgi:GntR family transcriptional regulator, galactonate operon transcriptional repressor